MPHVVKKEEKKPHISREHMEFVSEQNMLKCTSWDKTDLLICTPDRLSRILEQESKMITEGTKTSFKIQHRINPSFLAFLDYESMFTSKDELASLRPILRHFIGSYRSDLKTENQIRKVRT